jgi:cation transporter-like permease
MMFILLFFSAIYLFKRGMDPNNFLIPFLTSLADLLTPLFIILFIINFI